MEENQVVKKRKKWPIVLIILGSVTLIFIIAAVVLFMLFTSYRINIEKYNKIIYAIIIATPATTPNSSTTIGNIKSV